MQFLELRRDTVDEVEKRAGFVGNGTSDQCFAGTRWSVQQNAAGRLHTNRFEELWMTQRQLNHLFDQCQLLSASTNVVITHCCKSLFFFLKIIHVLNMNKTTSSLAAYLALDGLPITMDDGIRCDNAVWCWVSLHNLNKKHQSAPILYDLESIVTFEFNSTHASSHNENITFVNWAISF